MLYILFSIAIILPVLIGIGGVFQKIFGEVWSGISGKMFSGLFLLSMVWQILAFFIPLSIGVEIFTLIFGVVFFLYFRSYQEFYTINYNYSVQFFIFAGIVIFAGSYFPFILDHFGYYVPSINWLAEFGLTKGLANLSLNYAQMSIWHILQAGFSHLSDVYLRINVILFLAYLIYIFEKKVWHLLLVSPLFIMFFQSPSPDLPAVIISLIILNEVMAGNKNINLLFAFSVFVFSIKPTAIWLPAFVLFYFIRKENLKSFALGFLVLLVYVIKNIWLFGYPFFPLQIAGFGVEWQPTAEVMQRSSEVAIQKTYDLQFTIKQIQQFTLWDYICNWFTLASYKKYIHWAFILSWIAFVIFVLKKKNRMLIALLLAISMKSFLVLGFSAQYRFFLDAFFVFFATIFYGKIKERLSFYVFGVGAIFILLLITYPKILQSQISSFKLGYYMQGFVATQWLEPAHYQLNSYQNFTVGNLTFSVPNYDLSFDTPQPALALSELKKYEELGVFPQKIDNLIKNGFVTKKLSNAEKEKLMKIISSLQKNH